MKNFSREKAQDAQRGKVRETIWLTVGRRYEEEELYFEATGLLDAGELEHRRAGSAEELLRFLNGLRRELDVEEERMRGTNGELPGW